MRSVVLLNVSMLSVIMLSVVMLSVVVPSLVLVGKGWLTAYGVWQHNVLH
jgi:hypothetical protein